MYMSFLILMQICFSGTAGGGACGTAVGIAHITMTGDGIITAGCRVSILMLTRVGEDITGNIPGTDTSGIMNGFPTGDFDRIGGAGVVTSIGKGGEPGAYRVINISRINRDRN
jgi:hypothetical protein